MKYNKHLWAIILCVVLMFSSLTVYAESDNEIETIYETISIGEMVGDTRFQGIDEENVCVMKPTADILQEAFVGADSIAISEMADNSVQVSVTKVVNTYRIGDETYSVREEELFILDSLAASSATNNVATSNQAYGIVASNTLNYTVTSSGSEPDYVYRVIFNYMYAQYTELPTASTSVSRIEYVTEMFGATNYESFYYKMGSANLPTQNTRYQTNMYADLPFDASRSAKIAVKVYLTNGQVFEAVRFIL